MRVDVAARLPPGVAVEPVADDLDEAHQRLVAEHGLHQVVIDAEQIEKLRQVGRVPFAVQIGLGNADVAAVEQPRRKAVIVELSWPPPGPARCRQAGRCGRRAG